MALSCQGIYGQLQAMLTRPQKITVAKKSSLQNLDFAPLFEAPDDQAYAAYWEAYFQEASMKNLSFRIPISRKKLKKASEDGNRLKAEVSGYFLR